MAYLIRIVATPPGEAPLWVREQWVGLTLTPLTKGGEVRTRTFGVLSKRAHKLFSAAWEILRGRSEVVTGYMVETEHAVRALEAASPAAANWWREHTPELFGPGKCLVFHGEVCRVVV